MCFKNSATSVSKSCAAALQQVKHQQRIDPRRCWGAMCWRRAGHGGRCLGGGTTAFQARRAAEIFIVRYHLCMLSRSAPLARRAEQPQSLPRTPARRLCVRHLRARPGSFKSEVMDGGAGGGPQQLRLEPVRVVAATAVAALAAGCGQQTAGPRSIAACGLWAGYSFPDVLVLALPAAAT